MREIVLSKRQLNQLRGAWRDLVLDETADGPEPRDSALARMSLDAWLAGVVSSGNVRAESLNALLDQEGEVSGHPAAYACWTKVVRILMPDKDTESSLAATCGTTIRAHCAQRGYLLRDEGRDRFGYDDWTIEIPSRPGVVRLSVTSEVFLLTLPGGYTWPEFADEEGDAKEALRDQLQLVDAYADSRTRVVSVKRLLRHSRSELHLSDGTVLWRHGGRRTRK